MKLLLFLLLTGTDLLSYSQNNFPIRQKIYKISIAQTTAKISTGYLVTIDDSAISLAPSAASIRFNSIGEKDLEKIQYSSVEQIIIKRKGSAGRGILYGALIGFGTGAITGFIMGGDPPCNPNQQDFFGIGYGLCEAFRMTAGQKAVLLGGAGAVGGAIVGGIIGAVARKRFVIAGKKEKFDKMHKHYHSITF